MLLVVHELSDRVVVLLQLIDDDAGRTPVVAPVLDPFCIVSGLGQPRSRLL